MWYLWLALAASCCYCCCCCRRWRGWRWEHGRARHFRWCQWRVVRTTYRHTRAKRDLLSTRYGSHKSASHVLTDGSSRRRRVPEDGLRIAIGMAMWVWERLHLGVAVVCRGCRGR